MLKYTEVLASLLFSASSGKKFLQTFKCHEGF